MFGWLTTLISPVANIADKLVMDKDKYAELQFKRVELKHDKEMKLLETTTTPTIDAWVKLLMAFKDVILPMFRPVGSAAMSGFAIYCRIEGIELPPTAEALMAAAFPGWMTSRHMGKKKEQD